MAHRILKNAGLALPWMERRKELERERERIHAELARDRGRDPEGAVDRFRAAAGELNRRLALHNVDLPRSAVPAPPVDVERAARG